MFPYWLIVCASHVKMAGLIFFRLLYLYRFVCLCIIALHIAVGVYSRDHTRCLLFDLAFVCVCFFGPDDDEDVDTSIIEGCVDRERESVRKDVCC